LLLIEPYGLIFKANLNLGLAVIALVNHDFVHFTRPCCLAMIPSLAAPSPVHACRRSAKFIILTPVNAPLPPENFEGKIF
jgi:hypothetical protein